MSAAQPELDSLLILVLEFASIQPGQCSLAACKRIADRPHCMDVAWAFIDALCVVIGETLFGNKHRESDAICRELHALDVSKLSRRHIIVRWPMLFGQDREMAMIVLYLASRALCSRVDMP